MNAGGKGANQAVAAARLGGNVVFIAKTGNDVFGRQALELFGRENIDTSCILTDPIHPSGVALITVDDLAENCIVVAPGANAALTPKDLEPFEQIILQASILLIQLEIPLETVQYATRLASKGVAKIILNPAPAGALTDELLKQVHVITPNETEAGILTGISVIDEASAGAAAQRLQAKGIKTIIITLGSRGAFVMNGSESFLVPAPVVIPSDTTAAGDVFNGALAVGLYEQMQLVEAVRFACEAASLSVTRLGAQASAPYRKELN
jgi:ribokinase